MMKHDMRKTSQETQEAVRMRVVDAVRGGMSQSEAARVYGVSRQSVNGWMSRYRKGGKRLLKSRKRGPKGGIQLAPIQAAQTVRMITDRCPDQLKMPFALWTRAAVGQLIEERFGLRLSLSTIGRYLRRWGMTPQKPLRRAFEQNPEEVKRWLEEDYPAIRKEAKREKAQIHWGDEMGLRSDHQAGRSYGRKGHTPVITGTGKRFGCNMISSITNQGTLRFMIFKERFTSDVFIRFLQRLIESTDRRLFLIVDGHPVHKSTKAEAWLDRHAERIRLFLLPGYSPQLNPDEMLNNDVKTNALGRRRARTQEDLIGNVRSYLWSTQKHPEIVRSYFQAQSVQYAAA